MRFGLAILGWLIVVIGVTAQDPYASAGAWLQPPVGKSPNDLPPRAAKFRFEEDVQQVAHDDIRRAERTEPATASDSHRFPDLLDYLRPDRRANDKRRRDTDMGRVFDGSTSLDEFLDFRRDGMMLCDQEFDSLISPVTNPFLFEDPRALTEVRGLFLYQIIPNGQIDTLGGSIWYGGLQARVALNKRISLTINKLGITGTDFSSLARLRESSGFSEIWLGPKLTIIRDPGNDFLLASGLQFQIPVGSANVFQDTGSLSLVPYVSIAKAFSMGSLGRLNTMANTGYAFATNNQRSDYFYASGHISWDVMDKQKFFPLAELNWFQVTSNGSSRPAIQGEGRDLINFGSLAKGSGLLTGAIGARYRFNKHIEMGGAYEIPFSGNRDFFRHRFTVDLIFRY
jgi:Putative MetA-pathway of phenol degradation